MENKKITSLSLYNLKQIVKLKISYMSELEKYCIDLFFSNNNSISLYTDTYDELKDKINVLINYNPDIKHFVNIGNEINSEITEFNNLLI